MTENPKSNVIELSGAPRLKQGTFVVYHTDKYDDNCPDENWTPVKPEDVPDWIRNDPDILGVMVTRNVVSSADNVNWYRVLMV